VKLFNDLAESFDTQILHFIRDGCAYPFFVLLVVDFTEHRFSSYVGANLKSFPIAWMNNNLSCVLNIVQA